MKTQQEKFELIFDYLSGQVSGSEELNRLLAEDESVRAVYDGLRHTFSQLDCLGNEIVPVGLADRAISYVQVHSHTEDTVADIENRVVLIDNREFLRENRLGWVLGNFRDLFAIAACMAMIFLIGKPGLDYSRDLARQKQCQSQLAEMGSAFGGYASDHDGLVPKATGAVANNQSKWWNIGEQDPDIGVSNTSHVYKLVKDGYIRPERFICPSGQSDGDILAQVQSMTNNTARQYSDFISRDHVNYSFKLLDVSEIAHWGTNREAVAADKNPIFADFDSRLQNVVSVPDGSRLRTVNSRNHNNCGQIVLFSDGSVVFMKTRLYGPQEDDIFTLKKKVEYYGTEKPQQDDIFIAP